jgi:hypothetical protein
MQDPGSNLGQVITCSTKENKMSTKVLREAAVKALPRTRAVCKDSEEYRQLCQQLVNGWRTLSPREYNKINSRLQALRVKITARSRLFGQ